MRRTILIFYILLGTCSHGLAQEISGIYLSEKFRNESLTDIFSTISDKYPVEFFYREEWLPENRLDFTFENTQIINAISVLLEGTNLNYLLYYNAVIIAPEVRLSQDFSKNFLMLRDQQRNLLRSEEWMGTDMILSVGDSSTARGLYPATVTGSITDKLSGEALAGVNLSFKALNQTITTGPEGSYRIDLPSGYNPVEISHVGYDPRKIILIINGSGQLNLELLPDAYELEEILITGETDDRNIQSVSMGVTRLKPQQLATMPVFLGEPDVLKGIMTLPGVGSVGEGASGFTVRGGNIDQNLILQDEALIFNSSHALGFFSVFNSDAIREVELYKGHIPPQYGGRLSSVLNVKLKGNNNERLSGTGGIGVVSSRLVLEGPLRSKKSRASGVSAKTSFLLGGRFTYSDWILKLINIPDVKNSSGYFYDLNAKVTHRYNDRGAVSLSMYQSYDFVRFSDEYGFSWNNRTASLIWNHLIKPEITSSLSLSFGNNRNQSFEPYGIDAFELFNGIQNVRIKEDLLISSINKHSINTGIEYIYYDIQPDQLVARGTQSSVIPETVDRDNGQEFAIFAGDEYILNHLFSISYGLRYNLFQQLGPSKTYLYQQGMPKTMENVIDSVFYSTGSVIKTYQTLDPRISLKYSLSPTSSVKLSYNRTNQFIHLISNTTAAIPVDFWQVSNTYIAPERSDNLSIGYFRNFMKNIWESSIEIYYRHMNNLVEYKDLPELLLNDHLETELLYGRGRSYGIELFIRRRTGKINGWLSYTYSRSFIKIDGSPDQEQINRGEWYPSKLDRPNNLNIVLNIDFSKSSTFSANFTYQSGRPITAPEANYLLDDKIIPHFGDRNGYRIPDYHRLDVSWTLRRNVIRKRRYQDSFIFSIYNLYARKNAFSVFFRKEKGSYTNAYKLSVLGTIFPSITYNFKF